ncbi:MULTISPECIES: MFS transporter [unclassified Arthrobacter]|uniref:MFS transporter n=1 Tax=unclassified Arthrobacter TaxID=235627 RepID=UPI001D0005D0|nr:MULTISPECIES: MFS transporter [unclassified Arthrobacter]MCB5281055.1 3-hydroxybenzoate transporter MhbT [Arthrobacter sp. ES1]WGZ79896.1 MFS transporter [Arthrobacter sp. EM1]
MEQRGQRTAAGTSVPGANRRRLWGPVVGFGLVSLAADIVSDGARPLAGPLLAQLGASALVVGLVTGAAEAAAQGLRLLFGPWADRTRRYWTFTLAGYGLTAVCVPLLALAPLAGEAGLVLASVLIIGDRVGKAIRSPAKTVLLAAVTKQVGRGRGFAVHKSLDLLGAVLGPVLIAAVLAATGSMSVAFAVLALPAAAAMFMLFWLRLRVPSSVPAAVDALPPPGADRPATVFTRGFLLFAVAAFFWSAGLVAFGVIAFHLTTTAGVPVAVVPLLYAGAMAAAALGALASGVIYDRSGAAALLALPLLIAAVPPLALAPAAGLAFAGVLVWGTATGIQDSTVKALIADLVPEGRQGTAYGVFAAFEGAGALAGGGLYGSLYSSRPLLILAVAVLQLIAFSVLVVALFRNREPQRGRSARTLRQD